MRTTAFLVWASALMLSGCGKEQGRVAFSGEATNSATVNLAAGDVNFWTDIDIDYKGNAALLYEVELLQGGASVGKVSCDPLGPMSVKASWVETNIGDSHSRRGSGKMACSLKLAKGGDTTVKARLAFSKKPTSGGLKKADLVLKQ